jgi:hypothetical protein
MKGGVLWMLTAAGTVRVFHPIPFSFFAWEETNSEANLMQTHIQRHVYLNNVRQEFSMCHNSAHRKHVGKGSTFRKRLSLHVQIAANV